MNTTLPEINCDLMIIGTGMAGMAAALFAANRGISVVHAGSASELSFASGLIDLLAVHPTEKGVIHRDPWLALDQLIQSQPAHPYAKISKPDIQAALQEFFVFLEESRLPYISRPNRNADLLTPVGTIKTTYGVPQSMWHCVEALQSKLPLLIVDFHGLKGFSARQIAENLKSTYPVSTARVTFPGSATEIYTEHMAKTLENPEIRKALAQTLTPHLNQVQVVGLPAVLGLHRAKEVIQSLEEQLKVKLFEIPTMPPSVPGIRLKETFERRLPAKGITAFYQQKVLSVRQDEPGDVFAVEVGQEGESRQVRAKGVILASGRFFGGGLHADRKQIHETIFNLPVAQPQQRNQWHHKDLLDPRGQPINRAGLMIDDAFRPLAKNGKPAYSSLFAAGSILANQDWMREKSGSGIAIATAYAAVEAYLKISAQPS